MMVFADAREDDEEAQDGGKEATNTDVEGLSMLDHERGQQGQDQDGPHELGPADAVEMKNGTTVGKT